MNKRHNIKHVQSKIGYMYVQKNQKKGDRS